METFKNILLNKQYDEKIYIITINRETHANAIDRQTAEELANIFRKFENDDKALVAILTGKGNYFSSGADLKAISNTKNLHNNLNNQLNRLEPDGDGPLGITRMLLRKPVIAAINGFAVAGGFELILWCDLRITYKDCEMGVYCRRFGVPLIDGGTYRLPLLIGLSRAMDLILTGRTIKGKEGYDIGLINRIVEKREEVMDEALKMARDLCDLPQICMRNDRMSLLQSVYGFDVNKYIENEFKFGIEVLKSGESFRGAEKFVKGHGKHGEKVEKHSNTPKF